MVDRAAAMTSSMAEEDLQSVLEQMLQLRLDSPQDSSDDGGVTALPDGAADQVQAQSAAAPGAAVNPSVEWAEIIVSEMMSATSLDDGRSRAVRILEAFGASVIGSRAAKMMGDKERELGAALRQNTILKRAVIVQHRRQLEGEGKTKELQGMVAEYREKVRQLEISNYALSMHLRNAGPESSVPGPYHPEVL